MALKDDLTAEVADFFKPWSDADIRRGNVVPDASSVTFGNDAVQLRAATVMYADLRRSTAMVDLLKPTAAAACYKSFLRCAAKLIKSQDGVITAYDGDRVMAIFIGEDRADRAVIAALRIHWAVLYIINPAIQQRFKDIPDFTLQHTVGIDDGPLLAVKTGVRVDSDLVWIGAAANYAAKLNSFEGLDPSYPTRITAEVKALLSARTLRAATGEDMWDGGTTDGFNDLKTRVHYRSRWWRAPK